MQYAKALAAGSREDGLPSGVWKKTFLRLVNSSNGPPGKLRAVLFALIDLSDSDGRTWHSQHSIALHSGTKERTVRRHLDELQESGWVAKKAMTWSELAAEQSALSFPMPRRNDEGTAPDVILLCHKHKPAMEEMQLRVVGGGQIGQQPRPKRLITAPDKLADDPRFYAVDNYKEESDPDSETAHTFSLSDETREPVKRSVPAAPTVDLTAWNVLVEVHAEKTKAIYGLPPLPPDLKCDQQEALATALDGATAEILSRLHQRTGINREFADVRRELATTLVQLYFKGDNAYLRRVKHALRDLPREFHARLTDAMQALLRESHDAALPRRPKLATAAPAKIAASPLTPEIARQETIRQSRKLLDVLGASEPENPSSFRDNCKYALRSPVKRVDCEVEEQEYDKPAQPLCPPTERRASGDDALYSPVKLVDCEVEEQVTDKPVQTIPANDPNPLCPTSEAHKLLILLGLQGWCDVDFANELAYEGRAETIVQMISKLRIDEKVTPRARIRAMVYQAVYGRDKQ